MKKKNLTLLLVYLFCSFAGVAQTTSTEVATQNVSFGTYYIGFSNDAITKNPFYHIGIKGQNILSKQNSLSVLLDVNLMYGVEKYKDIYGFNTSAGIRMGKAFRNGSKFLENISPYIDITAGPSLFKNPISKRFDLGINSNLAIGVSYLNFGLEYSLSKIITDGINLNSHKISFILTFPDK